jgi:hypothetical protein
MKRTFQSVKYRVFFMGCLLGTLGVTLGMEQSQSNTNAPKREMLFYFYPSPGIDWSTPSLMARNATIHSALKRRRAIGHVSVRLECPEVRSILGNADGIEFTGMTQSQSNEAVPLILARGYGLGILYHTFLGRLESRSDLEAELSGRLQSGKLSFLRIQISPSVCERLSTYLKEYREGDYGKGYGLYLRPLHREGAGCSAFAASFLEVGGLLSPEITEAWSRTIRIPEKILGGPGRPFVSLLKVLNTGSWARKDEPHRELFFWDPDLMHEWALETYAEEASRPGGMYRPEKQFDARGLFWDASRIEAPRGPIWADER